MTVQMISKCQIILNQGKPMSHQHETESRLVLNRAFEGLYKKYIKLYPQWERDRASEVWQAHIKSITGETYAFRMLTVNLTRAIAFADIWIKEIKGDSND